MTNTTQSTSKLTFYDWLMRYRAHDGPVRDFINDSRRCRKELSGVTTWGELRSAMWGINCCACDEALNVSKYLAKRYEKYLAVPRG